jgi:uncharacterized cupredoxin-like copper-binding protein
MKGPRVFLLAVTLVLLLGESIGISQASSGMSMSGMDMGTPIPTAPAIASAPVRVVLTLTEFHIDVTPTVMPTIKVGQTVELIIVNAGQLAHETMVMAPGMASMSGMNMASMDAMSLLTVKQVELPPGGAPLIKTVIFPSAGDWQIACQLPGHEAMKATITVVA